MPTPGAGYKQPGADGPFCNRWVPPPRLPPHTAGSPSPLPSAATPPTGRAGPLSRPGIPHPPWASATGTWGSSASSCLGRWLSGGHPNLVNPTHNPEKNKSNRDLGNHPSRMRRFKSPSFHFLVKIQQEAPKPYCWESKLLMVLPLWK